MIIDCDRCEVRGAACSDCVVTVLLGAAPDGVDLAAPERAALAALAHGGLVPPLRWRAGGGADRTGAPAGPGGAAAARGTGRPAAVPRAG